jgi:hypothetical protein
MAFKALLIAASLSFDGPFARLLFGARMGMPSRVTPITLYRRDGRLDRFLFAADDVIATI